MDALNVMKPNLWKRFGSGRSSGTSDPEKVNQHPRNKRATWFFAAGLAVVASGAVLGAWSSVCMGVVLIALAVRYRQNPPVWGFLCLVGLAIGIDAWGVFSGSPISPLAAAIPLMLSYVFDYLDERRQKRAVAADATVTGGASHGGRPAEPSAPPNGGPATRLENSGAREGPPSVS